MKYNIAVQFPEFYLSRPGVLNFFLRRAGWDSSATERARTVFLFLEGGEYVRKSAHNEREARSPLRPGSRARWRALEALRL